MLTYHITTAIKSLRRNPIVTALLVGAIAIGICVATTFITLRHLLGQDPLPGQSRNLFYIRMDNWDPQRAYVPEDPKSLPNQITYRDMRELMKSNIPTRQNGSYKTNMFVFPDPKVARPYNEEVRFVFSDFFPMFRVPFRYGSGWDKRADAKPEPVVVISKATNDTLFGGVNSVGRTVRLESRDYKVVGVLDEWRPSTRFYDLTSDFVSPPEKIFIPFNFAPILEARSSGNSDGWKGFTGTTFADFLNSDTDFVQFWVELPTPARQAAYNDFLTGYVREQKKVGRFGRPLNNRVTNLTGLMDEWEVVPKQVKAMSIVSLLFLAVCSLNLVGLLLGKFLARVPEVSVRRALGASRLQVFWQHVVECELVGIAGGAIGLLLSLGILKVMTKLLPFGEIIRLDGEMVLTAIFLSLVAGLLAGIYPAWRVCSVPPAMQLKIG
ncbi:MAG TPA: ABC transporter permease [Thermoanaerobaculia bacterium]|jgi:putative ABC transport system permease protein|nr:ABC transporter permease [Thermoanaerobaculia bacterium]